ncbi:MAG: biopolymer transporter ExbD [Bacteroidales bacterium]|nr:biopolymer transporter ExbD [Bacteroidales bacterium]
MAKVKSKKHDTFIDMTAMSDVTVLLLTFFMLTANFIPKEPVQVVTPGSISETKIPEANIMTVLVDKAGHVYMTLDRKDNRLAVLEEISKDYNITFTPEQKRSFVEQPIIGMPVSLLPEFLNKRLEDQDKLLKEYSIPNDSTNNQFRQWVKHATAINKDLSIAIKADATTPYPVIKKVLDVMMGLKQYRFHLITVLDA